jgi:hypothetical protein
MIITKKHVLSFIFLAIFGLIQLALFSSLAQPVFAQTSGEKLFDSQIGVNEIGQVYGNKKTDVRVIVARLVVVVLGFLAAIFLALTIYAGFRYMTAAGNEEQVKKAVAQIRDSVIGLLIVLASWALTYFILRVLSRAVNNQVMIF